MAESETDQLLDGIEPPATETAETTAADTVAGDAQDTAQGDQGADTTAGGEGQDAVGGEGDDAAAGGEGGGEAATEQTTQADTSATDASYRQAQSALDGLQKQQTDLDAQLEQLDKDLADGKVDALDAGPRIQLLTARQSRLERQIAVATNALGQQQQAMNRQREQAMETHWSGLGKKYADIAETPEKATEALKAIWDEEYAKAQKANAGQHAERIIGKAEAAWENRIAVLRAQKGTAKPVARAAAKPPGRLTPNSGSVPPGVTKESGAAVAERTLGPLSNFKF